MHALGKARMVWKVPLGEAASSCLGWRRYVLPKRVISAPETTPSCTSAHGRLREQNGCLGMFILLLLFLWLFLGWFLLGLRRFTLYRRESWAGSQQTGAYSLVFKVSMSSWDSSKSNTCAFSRMRESVTDLGRGT